ncbi:MAG: class I SAM-dependent methyltransferase [Gemmatimonadota bacterium]
MTDPDPTHRFSDRVEDYARYRPKYPRAVIDVLREEVGLEATWVVADVGSGTGISSELFLDNGNPVHAVEPNDAMRAEAERRLGDRPGFHSVPGSAERTGLPPESAELAVAAQAFHWFDAARARDELACILRPPWWTVVMWNTRHIDRSAFLRDYESLLLRHGTDYRQVRHDRREGDIDVLFAQGFTRHVVPNEQQLDWAALQGRLLSSSYTPADGDPAREPMLAELRRIFEAHAVDGVVRMSYDTELLIGRVSRAT